LKNSLNKARNTMKRPNWLTEDVWDSLCRHWRSKSFKVKSLVAKANRASDCQGFEVSLHTAGSISISQHKENLVNFFFDSVLLKSYYSSIILNFLVI